jgi:hypothetical protein
MPCSPLKVNQHFGRTCFLHLQGSSATWFTLAYSWTLEIFLQSISKLHSTVSQKLELFNKCSFNRTLQHNVCCLWMDNFCNLAYVVVLQSICINVACALRLNRKYVQILCFWTLSVILKTVSCLYFKTHYFGDWILSPPSGWAQSIELISFSGHLYQHQDRAYKPNTAQTVCKTYGKTLKY